MSVRLTGEENKVAMFDSTTGRAFGPVFEDLDEAQAFIDYLDFAHDRDAQSFRDEKLEELLFKWREAREENA